MADAQFLLKTAPPRLSRALPTRARLEKRRAEISERTAILVIAPQGFGKTTLLAQWRRNWLEQGAFVAWASLDARDDRAQFVDLLLFALRAATGRESFATAAAQSRLQSSRELDTLTALLAEVAVLATPTIVVLDDAHRAPQAMVSELLGYLLNNAPPNLQFLIGSRRPLELPLTELVAAGRLASVEVADLRLSLEESLEFLRVRFGNRIGLDDAVRLHGLTEGWPLGLQLAASTVERAPDLHAVIGQLSARRGDLQRFFFESLMTQLSADEAGFLMRIAILEAVSAEVCEAVTGSRETAGYMQILADSPLVTEGEGRDWLRLHAMARDFLLGEFDRLPAEERRACYQRAAAWYADHGQLQEAARHALAAGDESQAIAHVSRCLRDIAREGRLAEARDWIRLLPASVMAHDVRLQLTVAWITAIGDAAATVPGMIEQISREPQFDDDCRFEAAIIAAAAATFCDKPGLITEAFRGWQDVPATASPLHLVSIANSQSFVALHQGDTEQVRQRLLPFVSAPNREPAMRLPLGFADLMIGLSYVAEGNFGKVLSILRPRLEMAEREMGRRNALPAMLSGPLAVAYIVQGQTEQALATLADRLDVIERTGMADSMILAYRTLGEAARRRGDEPYALEIFAGLSEVGSARDLPRVVLIGLEEQLRIHASRGRVETAAELLARIEAMRPVFELPAYLPYRGIYRRTRAGAVGQLALARGDYETAEAALRECADVPAPTRRRATTLAVRALLALAAHERGRPEGRDMLAEVVGLAELAGFRSYVEGYHPKIKDVLSSAVAPAREVPPAAVQLAARATGATTPAAQPATGGLLTPKEARILTLLSTGKANKEIARAMDIGEQTVKWHLKNVFFKLGAASRKHAVDRARLLGLLGA